MTFCQHKFHSFSQSSSEQSDVAPDSRGAESSSFSHRSQGSVEKQPSQSRVAGEKPFDGAGKDNFGGEPKSKPKKGDRFAGRKLSDIYVLELFAGTARLTRSFKKKGFRSLAFDKTSKRSEGSRHHRV